MKRKGFTLIELIVVMAILAILVLLGVPKYREYTKDAQLTKIKVDVKELENASLQFYIKNNSWPRLSDEPYSVEELETYAKRIRGKTGEEVILDSEGNYYDIDYAKLSNYIKIPDSSEKYILQNPVGSVYFLENLTEVGKTVIVARSNSPQKEDTTNAPGSKNLVGGNMEAGFFGEVTAEELISGNELASLVGITTGSSQYSQKTGINSTEWLKFSYKGNIQFVAKKPIRSSISWNFINAANAVYGGRFIEIEGNTYRVRLMRGINEVYQPDPKVIFDKYSGSVVHGSEWNLLMLPIHEQSIDKTWTAPNNVEDDIPTWVHRNGSGVNGLYTDADLITHDNYNKNGKGTRSWMQESFRTPYGSNYRVFRGVNGVSTSSYDDASWTPGAYAWRPVLELVP